MASINNIGGSGPGQRIINNPIQKSVGPDAEKVRPSATDRLELSGQSHLLQALKQNNGVRANKVAAIKNEIESGKYESDAKLDAAVERMLDDVL